jgi:hypothetical protein
MHTNSILNGLEIIGKLATRIRTTNRKHQEAIKIRACKVCKGLSSLRRCDQVTQPESTSSRVHYHRMDDMQVSSIRSSRDAHLELALLNLDDHHHLIPSSHGLYIWDLAFYTCPYMMGSFTTHNWQYLPYHKIRLSMWYILYDSCVDQFESSLRS